MITQIARRLGGTVAIVLLLALAYLTLQWFGRAPAGSYELVASMGEAGKGLRGGSDVKVRGVLAGTVKDVRLDEDANAIATLEIWGDRLPEDVVAQVTSKTFLGEKVIQIRPEGDSLAQGPFLQPGDTITVADDPTEVQDLLAAVEPHLDAIDPVQLGRVVEAFGTFTREDAEIAGRNVELIEELAGFAADTASEQLDRFDSLATLTGELATTAEDFNRLNRSLPTWVSLLPDRQQDVRANLDALSDFALVFADFLEVEEATIAPLLRVTTTVNGVLAGQAEDIGNLIYGIYRYALKLGGHGGALNDGSEHGWFTVFLGGEGEVGRLCESIPREIAEIAPGCAPDPDEAGQNSGQDSGQNSGQDSGQDSGENQDGQTPLPLPDDGEDPLPDPDDLTGLDEGGDR